MRIFAKHLGAKLPWKFQKIPAKNLQKGIFPLYIYILNEKQGS